jgi:hypothetical protein
MGSTMKDCTKSKTWQEANVRSHQTLRNKKESAIQRYNLNAKKCELCNEAIEYKRRYNKYCSSSCAAKVNNVKYPKRERTNKQTILIRSKSDKLPVVYKFICKFCSKAVESSNLNRKYCSQECANEFRYAETKDKFLSGSVVSHRTARNVLIKTYGPACMLCKWNQLNLATQKCPIELDHIDGNAQNTVVSNVRLLCPNCHSIQPTYKALNKGKGRHSRLQRYKEGKSY